jgi:hypothetical protein
MADLTPNNIPYGYLDRMVNRGSHLLADGWWKDLINRYGMTVELYPIDIDTSGRHHHYEEVFEFEQSKKIRMMLDLPSEAWMFSKFGLNTDADLTAIVHVGTWAQIFGSELVNEPKVGDIIRVYNTGWPEEELENSKALACCGLAGITDILNSNLCTTCQLAAAANNLMDTLPLSATCGEFQSALADSTLVVPSVSGMNPNDPSIWRRWPQLYQVTEKRYQDPELGVNFLNGHYVWVLKAKRFNYSFEEGAPQENPFADDNTPGGIVNDNIDRNENSNETISDDLFDYDDNGSGANDSPYGNY